MPKLINRIGFTYGRLTVVSYYGIKGRHHLWNCNCSCGGSAIVTGCNLTKGNTVSCGCVQKERTSKSCKKHGMSNTKIYRVWRQMINRCENSKDIMFYRYGKRGISVCERWHKFENFIEDMGIPKKKLEIDRIDNNGNYELSNCRWVTRTVNSRNKSNNVMVIFNGQKTTLTELSEKYGIQYKCLYKRYKLGWSINESISTRSGDKRIKMG